MPAPERQSCKIESNLWRAAAVGTKVVLYNALRNVSRFLLYNKSAIIQAPFGPSLPDYKAQEAGTHRELWDVPFGELHGVVLHNIQRSADPPPVIVDANFA
jgi:hypothetical protein